jgi:hypothetical protein
MLTLDTSDFNKPLTSLPEAKQSEEGSRAEPLTQPKSDDKEEKSVKAVTDKAAVENTPLHTRDGSCDSVSSRSSTSRPSPVSTP